MFTGLVMDGWGFEVVTGGDRTGPRRGLSAHDRLLLAEISARYVRGIHARAGDELFVGLGRELWSWLDGEQGQLSTLLERAAAPVTFEVRGPKSPSEVAWAVLRAPWELLARPGSGFLAADAVSRFAVVRRLGAPGVVPAPDGHRLGLAFMASAPRQQRELDFEAEEAAILAAVDETRVDLLVEDTGNPVQLGRRLADLGGMPVVHLSCHGVNRWQVGPDGPRVPVLMMEDEVGDELPTTPGELIEVMNQTPRLVFLSACLTATSADADGHLPPGLDQRAAVAAAVDADGTVAHSMSTSLVTAGIPAVLGWDGSVGDRAATLFAGHLYRQLSNRADLAGAVGDARRVVFGADDERVRADWHLARLWLGPSGGGPLVGGARRRSHVSAVHGTKVFLDNEEHVPVAAPEMFVGRRLELQQALRALRADRAGVMLHGQGRLGKSSLAARIADRSPQLVPAVVFGDYSATAILEVIEQAVRTIPAARDMIAQRRGQVRDQPEAFEPLLTDLLAGPLARADEGQRALLLIIDDLEQILIVDPNGPHRVDPQLAPVLAAVLRAFDPAVTDSRLLLTSRYQFTLDGLPQRLEQIPLRPLSLVARLKLLNRQQAHASAQLQAERFPLAARAAEVSRGNPGLQDLIGLRLVYSDQVDTDRAEAAVADMEAYLRHGDLPAEPQLRQFLENLALDTLLELAGPAHRALLRDLTLFELPVPEPAVTAVAQHSGGSAARLRGLGLLDTFPDSHQPRLTATAVNMLAAGRITPLNDEEITALATLAITPLFVAWGGDCGEPRSLPMDLELTRLALHAANPQVTAACAASAVLALTAGPAAAALQFGHSAIALLDQHHRPVSVTLLRQVANAAKLSGDGETAGQIFARATQQALEADPVDLARVTAEHATYLIDRGEMHRSEQLLQKARQLFASAGAEQEAASCQKAIADIYCKRGDYDRALRILNEEVLPVYDRLGDVRSAASAWGDIADICVYRGDYDEALQIRRNVELPVYDRLGEARSAASAWGKIADIAFRRGAYDEALRIHREEALPVFVRLGDARERALTWGKIANILFERGDYDEALRIHREEALPVFVRLGDARESALTWGKIADTLFERGDYDEALRLRREVELPAYSEVGDIRTRAIALGKIADILFKRGDYDEALRIHREEALPVFVRLGDARESALTWGKIADILYLRGDYNEVAALRTKQLRVNEGLGDVDGIAAAKWGLALVQLHRGNYESALPLLGESFRALQRLQRPDGIAAVGAMIGSVLLAAGAREQAISVLETSKAAAESINAAELCQEIGHLINQARGKG
ncbi:tetratricopeptide repeat protein [Actinoplanes sp. NPDC051343]|uniref:tetratricopeptide repeat protein n=1 Tax=Actinoplanes sp. NPDC051343 TaxID=3363906 RepID=UPI003789B223